jgi:hypothetical protein
MNTCYCGKSLIITSAYGFINWNYETCGEHTFIESVIQNNIYYIINYSVLQFIYPNTFRLQVSRQNTIIKNKNNTILELNFTTPYSTNVINKLLKLISFI